MKKILLIVGILLLFANSAFAWRMPRWSSSPIRVYVQDTEQAEIVKRAFSTWQGASGGLIRFRYINTYKANINAPIVVNFVNRMDDDSKAFTSREEIGGFFYRVTITIAIKNDKDELLKNDEIYSIALQEIGYSLGLNLYGGKLDVMNPANAGTVTKLSDRDIENLRNIYTMSRYKSR